MRENKEGFKVNIDDSLTIILPLYGRQRYTKHFLGYLNYIRCPFRVLIADGGKEDLSAIINKENYPNVNFTYVKYPFDEDIKSYMKKMRDIYTLVKTPLTIMMDNDDLFCLNGLYEGVEFLAKNNDYVGYRQDVREIIFQPSDVKLHKSIYNSPSLDSPQPLGRIKDSIESRNALWHDITRATVHTEFFDIISALDINDYQLAVSLQCYYPLIFGKTFRDKKRPYYYHIPGSSTVQGTGKLTRYVNWAKSSFFEKSAAQAVSIIGNALSHHTGEDLNQSKIKFAKMFFNHVIRANKVSGDTSLEEQVEKYVNKYINLSFEFDETVQKCLAKKRSYNLFEIDEERSYDKLYEQSLQIIRDFTYKKGAQVDDYMIVLGDSHSRSFTHNTHFLSIFIGPGKQVNFTTDEIAEETKNRLLNNLSRLDNHKNVMLVFGEPDARLYLENHSGLRDQYDEDTFIKLSTERYLKVALEVQKNIPGKVIVYNAVPCPRQDQNLFSKKYNLALSELCSKHDISFIDIWNEVVQDNILDETYSVDHIHLSEKITPLVIRQLKSKRLIDRSIEEENNYSWSYFYKFNIDSTESRIWGDAANSNTSEKFKRTEEVKEALLALNSDKLSSLDTGSKILILQCAEGFPIYHLPNQNRYQIFACDTEENRIKMATRVGAFTGLKNISFAYYSLSVIESASWPEFDAVIYIAREEGERKDRFINAISRIPAKLKLMV
tara:strand:- start:275 stop:2434 length:2160 start_codon:yes stop_codon:yes gene_type:complete